MTVRIIVGDALETLRTLPPGHVHVCCTSPPYFGLRDYGMAGQIGLEPTPDAYIAALVAVFREVRRVLRPDGTLWVNIGDSYAGGGQTDKGWRNGSGRADGVVDDRGQRNRDGLGRVAGIKPKDLIGIPWMLAFALRSDGWYLRQDIIWHKPNPMPESVTDRCTKSHEYLFLLSKSERYYYDAAAIAEPAQDWSRGGPGEGIVETFHYGAGNGGNSGLANLARRYKGRKRSDPIGGASHKERGQHSEGGVVSEYTHRNKRSVWTVNSNAFPEAHFATFPPALIEPCILAGCPKDCCAKCGAPWERQVEKTRSFESGSGRAGNMPIGKNGAGLQGGGETGDIRRGPVVHTLTTGWVPSCACGAKVVPGVCLDPFSGAGTTGLVADRLGRNAILIELNPLYAGMAERRIYRDGPLFADVAIEAAAD